MSGTADRVPDRRAGFRFATRAGNCHDAASSAAPVPPMLVDTVNAFVPGPEVRVQGRASGPLSGLHFADKDLFDVAGHPTGGRSEARRVGKECVSTFRSRW